MSNAAPFLTSRRDEHKFMSLYMLASTVKGALTM